MNYFQKILGIDQIVLSVKRLQAELAEEMEKNRQYEEEIAQLRQQLLQNAQSQSKETAQAVTTEAQVVKYSEQSSADKMKIAELKERYRKLTETIDNPQAAFLAYMKE